MRALFIPLLIVIIVNVSIAAPAQLTPQDIAERAKWEEFMAQAEISGQEQIKEREAVTEPWRLTLSKDGVTRDGLWKDVELSRGYVDNWRYEIAAYRFDLYLGLNMVPPTIERSFHGNRGSLQLWMESEMSLHTQTVKKIPVPPIRLFYWNRAIYLQRFFDNLIGNEDRHANNIRVTKDWRVILIDHSRSFRTSKKFTKELLYTEKFKEGPRIMKELPRAMIEKIKALNFDLIRNFVGEYLSDDEIKAVLLRRDLILQEVDKLIKQFGEDKVLY